MLFCSLPAGVFAVLSGDYGVISSSVMRGAYSVQRSALVEILRVAQNDPAPNYGIRLFHAGQAKGEEYHVVSLI